MPFAGINHLAIFVAAIAGWLGGAVYYTLLAKPWVAAQGLTYEAAAELVGCQVGTVKSRVSRARAFLAGSLGMSDERLSA